ncbi:MAG: peptide deformylase [Candidatus Niyogibacteria bacterium]|nr:peptide deformylase [Candidatus Niyogibacteria bacterium]
MTIIQQSNPLLHQKSEHIPIANIPQKATQNLIERMKRTLRAEPDGIGLAAPQIGVSKAVFIVSEHVLRPPEAKEETDEARKKQKETERYLVFINPRIMKLSKKTKLMHEGCLSVRGVYGMVKRSTNVTVEAYDEYGKKFTRGAGGLLAHVIQHETDHVNGILFIDTALSVEKAA